MCLGTPELLEEILMHMDSRDILLNQRVCKLWAKTIDHSIWLQRMIFMKPVDCGQVSWLDWRFDDKRLYTTVHLGEPLRARRHTGGFRYVAHWGQSRVDGGKFQVFINPMLAKRFPIISRDMVKAGPVYAIGGGMDNPAASWKKMLITQPPINTMFLEWDHDSDIHRVYRDRGWSVVPMNRFPGSHGITAADLIEHMPRQTTGFVWIEGSEFWQKFVGLESLHDVVQEQCAKDSTYQQEDQQSVGDADGDDDVVVGW